MQGVNRHLVTFLVIKQGVLLLFCLYSEKTIVYGDITKVQVKYQIQSTLYELHGTFGILFCIYNLNLSNEEKRSLYIYYLFYRKRVTRGGDKTPWSILSNHTATVLGKSQR